MHDPHQLHPSTTINARQTPPSTPPMMGARGTEGCEEELLDSVVKLGVGEAPPEYIVVVTILSSSGEASRRITMGVAGITVTLSLYLVARASSEKRADAGLLRCYSRPELEAGAFMKRNEDERSTKDSQEEWSSRTAGKDTGGGPYQRGALASSLRVKTRGAQS